MKTIRKLLVANRSEIAIRVFRAAHELGIRTVAIYSHEDRYALHRFKADEAYSIGKPASRFASYLDIDGDRRRARVGTASTRSIPAMAFCPRIPHCARACDEAGITSSALAPRCWSNSATRSRPARSPTRRSVPILGRQRQAAAEHSTKLAELADEARLSGDAQSGRAAAAAACAWSSLPTSWPADWNQAQREAQAAFGNGDVFLEKYIRRPRHIEVQMLGDKHGNSCICSSATARCSAGTRRWSRSRRRRISIRRCATSFCEAALRDRPRGPAIENAGTVEFLVDADTGKFYFIEVNPRIQVEHTVTEEVTGIDIVKARS